MTEAILSTREVGRRFGGFTALQGISLDFVSGKLTAIIGPNGAGKSTFFNILSGSLAPSEGRVIYQGRDIAGLPQHRFAHLGIAKSFQITNVFPQLTALENVRVAAQAMTRRFDFWTNREQLAGPKETAEALLDRVGLGHRRHAPADTLAHGEQRALEIALALASDPRVLLLDEPTAGMSPEEARAMMDLILEVGAERTVILVEHRMKLVMGISDRIVVLHHGQLLAEGPPDEIRRNDEVRRVYLGQSV